MTKTLGQKSVENFIRSHVNELKKSSLIEMLGEAAQQMQLTPEALKELEQDKKFLFLLGQIAELHAILWLADVKPKKIKVVRTMKKSKPKKKKARKK